MNIWSRLLKWFGWSFNVSVQIPDKCVICVAPHTSNWDFPLGLAAYKSIGREANFLMKSFWFFFPLKYLLKKLGGIPVYRSGSRSGSLTQQVIEKFKTSSYLNLAVTPEGTRGRTGHWKTGFLYIAYGADAPLCLAVIDYRTRQMSIDRIFQPTGDIEADMKAVKEYYRHRATGAGRFPDNFTV